MIVRKNPEELYQNAFIAALLPDMIVLSLCVETVPFKLGSQKVDVCQFHKSTISGEQFPVIPHVFL